MTISEAVSLTLQASTKSEGSEIFVLDMGDPIRIVDLAENMIRLAGMVPYEDIEIQFTGLRPGEKLMEEINGKGEGVQRTDQEKMRLICEQPLSWEVIPEWIGELGGVTGFQSGADTSRTSAGWCRNTVPAQHARRLTRKNRAGPRRLLPALLASRNGMATEPHAMKVWTGPDPSHLRA